MKHTLLLFYLFISLAPAQAALFDGDDRFEIKNAPLFWQELGRSVPALVPKRNMSQTDQGWILQARQLTTIGLCSDEAFAHQQIIANCSASLIGEDLILTAAHCIDDRHTQGCQDYGIVFDYHLESKANESAPFFAHDDQVYFCQEVLYHQFKYDGSEDVAIIRLDRPVVDREPVNLNPRHLEVGDELNMIGYPLGTFQKWVSRGVVTEIEEEKVSFKNTLDSFSVNSGGPIFDAVSGDQVGVLVRGSGGNFQRDQDCHRWMIARDSDFSEGNSLWHLDWP